MTEKLLRMRHLLDLHLAIPTVIDVGTTQRFAAIAGGHFEGDRLRGIVLPGGDDWITVRDDGASLLNARAVLKTEDDTIIGMSWTGIRHGSIEVMRRIAAGEDVDPDSYYFRANFSFTAADGRYVWINRILASARGKRGANAVDYSVFELL